MFPLSCACAHISRAARAPTRKLGAHINTPSKNVLAHISHVVLNTDESWENVAQEEFCVHTDFEKLEGTLVMSCFPTTNWHRTMTLHPTWSQILETGANSSLPYISLYVANFK